MGAEMSDMDRDPALQELLDKQEIYECIAKLARGLDRHDLEMAKSSFHPDAMDDHASFIGPAAETVDWSNDVHDASFKGHQHYMGQCLIEVDGDEAHAETYGMVVGVPHGGWEVVMGGGRYLDRLERRGGRWAIVDRVATAEWWTDTATMEFLAPFVHPYSQNRNDPSYDRPLRVTRAASTASEGEKIF